jgi:hypothetical protein
MTHKTKTPVYPKEATITVAGIRLSDAESMTVRVALNSLLEEIKADGLGEDSQSKSIAENYVKHASSVLNKIHTDIEY